MSEESEYALAIVCRNSNDSLSSHSVAGIARFATAATHQSAAIEVDEHRQMLVHLLCRSPDVQVQTVLAHFFCPEIHITEKVLLHRVGAKLLCLANTMPFPCRLRSFPAKFSHRRCGKRNTPECLYPRFVNAFECPFSHLHLHCLLCKQYCCEQCKHRCHNSSFHCMMFF